MLILIAACTFGSVMFFVLALTMKSERELIQERMRRHAQTGSTEATAVEMELLPSFRERVIMPFLHSLARLGSRLTPGGATHGIEGKLETAGRPWKLGAREFMGLKVLSIAAGTVLGLGVSTFFVYAPLIKLMMLFLLIFIGVIFPDYALQSAINTRQSQVRKVLADTLDLLTVSVEAGLGLDGAMQRVVEKFNNPLSEEMKRALQEMQVGKMRTEALRDMAGRMKVQELSTFVASVCQADQLGVSISKVLRVQGETLRQVRSQRARETAAKLPVKMLFPLVVFIFPAIFVVVLGPAMISIFKAFGIMQ